MTAMTFSTKRLVELAKAAIANKDAAVAEWKAIKDQFVAEHEAEWRKGHIEHVRAARDYLSKCLKNGATPTSDDLHSVADGWSLRELMYSPPSDYSIERSLQNQVPKHLKLDTTDYRALIETLESSNATHVSPNQLAILGFKSSSLQKLFRDSLAAE